MTESQGTDQRVGEIKDSVMRLARLINQPKSHDVVLKASGANLDKLSEIILSHLVEKDDAELRLSDLARRLGVELSSVSRKVHKLEEARLLTRTTDSNDGRAFRLHLTDLGRDQLHLMHVGRCGLLSEVLAPWSGADQQTLAELLERFTADVTEYLGANND